MASRAGGADKEDFIIHNLPLVLADSAPTWLEHLPSGWIHSWTDLRNVFVGNFQGTYLRPGNPWDLRSCRQKSDESLWAYIWHFSRQCNELPNISKVNVIRAFITRMTCKTLVHKLGQKSLRTTKELLEIAKSHASSEEAVMAIFPSAADSKRKGKWDEADGMGPSDQPNKKNKNKQRPAGDALVASADRKGAKAPVAEAPDLFDKKWNGRVPTTHTL